MWETNMKNVRFVWDALSIMVVRCMTYACGFVPHWSYPCLLWLRMCDVCHLYVISNMFSCTWFLYIEEFSILPCPACLTCQPYISVGLTHDTLCDTVTCRVSKIRLCIRYDGWITKLGMCEVNIRNVRFVWNALPITMVWCMMYAYGFVLHWLYPCSSWLCMYDICCLYVTSTTIS